MDDSFDRGDTSRLMAGAVHDAGILLNHSGGVGASADSNRAVFSVQLGNLDPVFNRVEDGAPLREDTEGFVV